MKITASSLFSNSFSSLGTSLGNLKKADSTGRSNESPDSKRLKGLQDGLHRLKAGMNPKQFSKKASSEKIGMLQRRLMELKQMLLHATPEQAKALARELKSIAGELASAAKAAGGSQGTSALAPVVSGADTASASSESEAVSAANSAQAAPSTDAQAAEGAATEAKEAADATASQDKDPAAGQADKAAQKESGVSGDKRSDNSPGSIEVPDKVLKDMLKEARRLLKEAIDMVKLKMGHGDKESRKDLEEAEKKLQDIGFNTETQATSASFYTSQGIGTPDIGSLDGAASAGTNISVEA